MVGPGVAAVVAHSQAETDAYICGSAILNQGVHSARKAQRHKKAMHFKKS